jgi:hypothetical protein
MRESNLKTDACRQAGIMPFRPWAGGQGVGDWLSGPHVVGGATPGGSDQAMGKAMFTFSNYSVQRIRKCDINCYTVLAYTW